MNVINIAGIISATINFGMSILHFCLLFGMPFGEYVLGGNHKVIPKTKRYVNLLLGILWIIMGLIYLEKVGIIHLFYNYKTIVNVLLIAFTIFLGIATISNAFITRSSKERFVMTPLSIVVFLCSIIIISL